MRRYMYEPIPAVYYAAELLSEAVAAHLAASFKDARRLIAAADTQEIRDWHWPIISTWPWVILPSEPLQLPKNQRASPRMPTKITCAEVLTRDGHHCRFCGIPVISKEARKAMVRDYGDVITWSRKFNECHAAFQCMALCFDHILPHQRGGTSEAQNIAIACDPCNYGRMHYTVREVGVAHPLANPPLQNHWLGYSKWEGLRHYA